MNFDSPRRIDGIEDYRTNAVDHPRATVQMVKPNPWKHIPVAVYTTAGSVLAVIVGTLVWGLHVLAVFLVVVSFGLILCVVVIALADVWRQAKREAEKEASEINRIRLLRQLDKREGR